LAADAYAMDGYQEPDFMKEVKADLWEIKGQAGDKIGQKVGEIVESLEGRLLPIIRGEK
jgi:hypothetical protein